jgi:hypothetical protein
VERAGFATRWKTIQASFAVDPAVAVTATNELINEVMRALSQIVRRAPAREPRHLGPARSAPLRSAAARPSGIRMRTNATTKPKLLVYSRALVLDF